MRVLGLGQLVDVDRRAGRAGEAAVAGDVVGVVVGLQHVLDPHPVQAAEVQVGVDVPLRVDHRGDAGCGVADQVGGAAEVLVDDLAEEHWVTGLDFERVPFGIQGSGRGRERNGESRRARVLERELSALLEVERFEPPAEFRERALWSDPAVYEEAAADPEAWWLRQATELLDWIEQPSAGARRVQPALLQVVRRRQAERLGQLPRPPRRGGPRRPRRLPLARRGGRGARRHLRRAARRRAALRQRPASDHGIGKGDVVGIYLPMIPEVVVAMLACARIGAIHNVVFGGFSAEAVRERMEFSEAKALITVDGARRKGKTAPVKSQVDEVIGELGSIETIFVVQPHRRRVRDAGGARRLVRRGAARRPMPSARRSRWAPRTRSSSSTPRARPRSRRASCTPPAAT